VRADVVFLTRQLEQTLDRLGVAEHGLATLREEMQGVRNQLDVMSRRPSPWSPAQMQALAAEAMDFVEAGRGRRETAPRYQRPTSRRLVTGAAVQGPRDA
jgi:citrate lyase beta subunit